MNLKFDITGICTVHDPDLRPTAEEIAKAFEELFKEVDVDATICVYNMREE